MIPSVLGLPSEQFNLNLHAYIEHHRSHDVERREVDVQLPGQPEEQKH